MWEPGRQRVKEGQQRTQCWLVTEIGPEPAVSPESQDIVSLLTGLSEFPDNQNIVKTLPEAHQCQSIFAKTKFQQNLELLKSVLM
jgi:hypothetical protein